MTARDLWVLLGFIAACFGVAALGGYWTYLSVPEWYGQLAKPSWTPPSWLFGPVWTVLYLMIAFAAWLVWRTEGWQGALSLWAVHLLLNLAWSGLFFGLRSPGLAFAEIVALWLSILLTLVIFWKVRRAAGALLVPYLLWVTFAMALNFAVWRLNA